MREEETGKRLFTKHLFRTGCKCPTKLYYKFDSSVYPEQDFYFAHLTHNRKLLKRLLNAVFQGGETIVWDDGYQETAAATGEYLKQSEVTLFDAAFLYDDCFVKIPALKKKGLRVDIYQVQSKAFDPSRHKLTDSSGKVRPKWKDYLKDFAYQLYIVARAHPDWELTPHLVVPRQKGKSSVDSLDRLLENEDKIPPGEPGNLLVFLPVKELIERFWEGDEPLVDNEAAHPLSGASFEESLMKMKEWYTAGERIFAGVGKKCIGCEFNVDSNKIESSRKSGFRECWEEVLGEQVDEPHIFELIGAGTGTLLAKEVYLQKDVPLEGETPLKSVTGSEGRLTDSGRRRLQLEKTRGGEIPEVLIKNQLFTELERWEYPFHFLDFEAGSYPVPIRSNREPYHQVAFQYSCHTLYPDGTLEHNQWLHQGGDEFPGYELVQSLKGVPDISQGTIVQYSGFERSALKRIAAEIRRDRDTLPEAEEAIGWIKEIIRRNDTHTPGGPFMSDLSRMVRYYYVNDRMGDSLSIKDVVQSVMEVSPVLQRRFSIVHISPNLGEVVWWQRSDGRVRNPYDILRGQQFLQIGRGTEAMVAYSKLRTGGYSDVETDQVISSLQAYCELDTLAMVMIYLHWQEASNHLDTETT